MFIKHLLKRMTQLVQQVVGAISTQTKDLHLNEGIGSSGSETVALGKQHPAAVGGHPRVWFSGIDSSPLWQTAFAGEDEFLLMNRFPALDIIADYPVHPERYPGIAQHLTNPGDTRSLGASDDINEGAQGARDLGLWLLWFYLNREGTKFWTFLYSGIRALKKFEATLETPQASCFSHDRRDGGHQDPLLYLNQVFFTGGGTGSSQALLLNYLCRHQLFREAGLREIRFNADLLLPGNITQVEDSLRRGANTFRTLTEIMEHYRVSQPPLVYGPLKIQRSAKPYSVLTLFGVQTANGQTILTEEQVRHVVAEVRAQKTYGPVAAYYTSHLLVDVAPYLRYPYIGSAAFGGRWTIPLSQIMADFSLGTGTVLVQAVLLRERPAAQARAWGQQRLQAFLNQHHLQEVTQFFQQDRGRWLGFDLAPYKRVRLQVLKLSLADYETRTVRAWEQSLNRLLKENLGRLSRALDEWVVKLINDPEGGLGQVPNFLGANEPENSYGLIGWLQQQRHLVHQQLAGVNRQLDQHQGGGGSQGWWKRFKQAWQFPRQRLFKHYDTRLELRQEQVILTKAQGLIEGLLARAYWWIKEVDSWQATLKQLAQTLQQQRQELADYRQGQQKVNVAVINVLCPEEEQRLYQQHLSQVLLIAQDLVDFVWEEGKLVLQYRLLEISQQPPQTSAAHREAVLSDEGIVGFLEFLAALWLRLKAVTALSVEAIWKQQGKSPQQIYEEMRQLVSPLVTVDKKEQIRPIREEVILGSETGQAFWGDLAKSDLAVIQTEDRFNTTCLVTWWEINPLALTNTEASWRAYEYLLAQGEQLDVFVLDESPGEGDQLTDQPPKTEPVVTDPGEPEIESEEINVVSEK